jgi:hypothetical protein
VFSPEKLVVHDTLPFRSPSTGIFEQSQLLTTAILAPRTVWSSSTYAQIRVGDSNNQFRHKVLLVLQWHFAPKRG